MTHFKKWDYHRSTCKFADAANSDPETPRVDPLLSTRTPAYGTAPVVWIVAKVRKAVDLRVLELGCAECSCSMSQGQVDAGATQVGETLTLLASAHQFVPK